MGDSNGIYLLANRSGTTGITARCDVLGFKSELKIKKTLDFVSIILYLQV